MLLCEFLQVKITLEPLSNLLPKEKREAFELAYHFYGAAVGMSKTDLVAMGGKTTTIGDAVSIVLLEGPLHANGCASACLPAFTGDLFSLALKPSPSYLTCQCEAAWKASD